MKALFTSRNLIGDALNISPALRRWAKEHPEKGITLRTLPDHVQEIYQYMGVELTVVNDADESNYDFVHDFDISKAFAVGERDKVHMVDAYGKLLFDELGGLEEELTYQPPEMEHEKDLILLAPFSRSCASNEPNKLPNKMIGWQAWQGITTLLRQYGRLGVLGAATDTGPVLWARDEYKTGKSLREVAWMMRDARLLVTIDNGMAHMGASQGVPMIEFYPACLGLHWAVPRKKEKLFVVQQDPAQLLPKQALMIVQTGLEQVWERP